MPSESGDEPAEAKHGAQIIEKEIAEAKRAEPVREKYFKIAEITVGNHVRKNHKIAEITVGKHVRKNHGDGQIRKGKLFHLYIGQGHLKRQNKKIGGPKVNGYEIRGVQKFYYNKTVKP